MIPQFLNDNLAAWVAQVFVIATLGAYLPRVFRIRHPRTQLAYCHFVLAACAILPLIQPWHHAISAPDSISSGMALRAGLHHSAISGHVPIAWDRIVLWILAAGFAARLGWLGIGLLRIRQYRVASTPLCPVPDTVKLAWDRIGVEALFSISTEARSPATVGFFRPIVLLPETFLQLSPAAQHGIACHELLHVRRRDWLVTVVEEVVAAVFWFHPGVWWLMAQTRLSREQLVDAEVVQRTAAREEYIAALLAIAGTRLQLDLAPAPLFLRRRHLTQRMQLLLTEVSMSRLRLVSSYTAMASILATAAWVMFLSFPLEGQAQVAVRSEQSATATEASEHSAESARPARQASQTLPAAIPSRPAAVSAQDVPAQAVPEDDQRYSDAARRAHIQGIAVESAAPPPPSPSPSQDGENHPIRVGGEVASRNLVYKVNPPYPPEARQARIQGVVILNVMIAKDGKVSDVKIISSSHPLLLPGAVEAVQQWVYSPTLMNGQPVEVITTVTINYSLAQ